MCRIPNGASIGSGSRWQRRGARAAVRSGPSLLGVGPNASAGAVLGIRPSAQVRIRDNDPGPHFDAATYLPVQDIGTLRIGVHRG